MENQLLARTEGEAPTLVDCGEIEELFDFQLAIIGGGCVEYCPY